MRIEYDKRTLALKVCFSLYIVLKVMGLSGSVSHAALEKIRKIYLEPTAHCDQKRYLRHHSFKPKDMGVQSFAAWIEETNRTIEFMPGKGEPLREDEELMEILWFALPPWYRVMVA